MPILVDHTGDFRALADLLGSLALTTEHQATVLEHVRRLCADQAPTHDTGLGPVPGARILPLREAERRHLLAALRHTGGKIYGRDGAAKLLDLKPTTLQSKLKKHGINRLDATGEDGSAEGSGSIPPPSSDGSFGRTPSGAMQRAAE
jgi:transcriptional regulator of acetoin/glycerol metabolism